MKNDSLLCNALKITLLVLSLLFVIPAILNWALQQESGLKSIIGGKNGPVEWLHFWGTYLAALGTFFAAFVALYNERKNRKRDFLSRRLQRIRNDYETIQSEVMNLDSLHSINRLASIVSLINQKRDAEAYNEVVDYYSRLQSVIFWAEWFMAFYPENQYYLSALRKINSKYSEYANKIQIILVLEEDHLGQANKFLNDVASDPDLNNLQNDFRNKGGDCLRNLRNSITDLDNSLEKLN